jgi:hypothetical protein
MGGAAGSELWGATDKSAAERLEAALLGNILNKSNERNFFSDIYQNCSSGYSATILLVATKTPLPAAPSDDTLSPVFARPPLGTPLRVIRGLALCLSVGSIH